MEDEEMLETTNETENVETKKAGKYLSMINGKALYFRIIIKKKREGR